jgi:hypothetical protein
LALLQAPAKVSEVACLCSTSNETLRRGPAALLPTQEALRREDGASKAAAAALTEQLESARAELAAAVAVVTDGIRDPRQDGGDGGAAWAPADVGAVLERALAPVQASLAALQEQARPEP